MTGRDARTDILHDKLLSDLHRELANTNPDARTALRAAFAEKSQDYRTLALMDEMPAHAAGAAAAWREIAPRSEPLPDLRLLQMLSEVYALAASRDT